MIICECTGTTDETIRSLACEGITKVSEVGQRCGAGTCCQSCRPAIKRILRAAAISKTGTSALALPVSAGVATI